MNAVSCFLLVALSGTAPPAFEWLDVDTIDGRPVNRYRPLELGERPVRPVGWDETPPGGLRYGLVPVGTHTDSSLAFAWDPARSVLWLDADGDRRLTRDERHEVKAGPPVSVPVTIQAQAGTTGPADAFRRVMLVRPGIFGGAPRYCVRGCAAGALDLGGRAVRALLTDGDADGCVDAAGTDRVWLDLDGDGHFDPATEQFPLGSRVVAGRTSYTVAADPWARAVRAHERDPRMGRVRLSLGSPDRKARLVGLSANLVSETGELITVERPDEPAEAPVGRYRVAGLSVQLDDGTGLVWSYTFTSGRAVVLAVEPDGEARTDLIDGLTLDLDVADRGGARPGDEVDVTPHLRLPSGLYLANCTTRRAGAYRDDDRSAEMILRGPTADPLDRAVSGFA